MIGNNLPIMTTRKKKRFLQHKNKNMKEAYTDELNSIGKKVCFTPEEVTIHKVKMTAIKITMKEIYKR